MRSSKGKTTVEAYVESLMPGQHGIHIHEFGNLTDVIFHNSPRLPFIRDAILQDLISILKIRSMEVLKIKKGMLETWEILNQRFVATSTLQKVDKRELEFPLF